MPPKGKSKASPSKASSDRLSSGSTSGNKKSPPPKPLLGLRCFVEVSTEDSINTSDIYVKLLRELGAQVDDAFSDNLSHYITSNGHSKRAKAAELFDIIVVSPLWVDQCSESKSRAVEEDFTFTTPPPIPTAPPAANKASNPANKVIAKEPVVNEIETFRNIDSPTFSSSQRPDVITPAALGGKRAASKTAKRQSKAKTEVKIIEDDEEEDEVTAIPLPSFQPYQPKLAAKLSAAPAHIRRSERISDFHDSDEELQELHIPPNKTIPIVRYEEEADEERERVVTTSSSASAVPIVPSSSSSARKAVAKGKLVLAMTGFDSIDGEKETTQALITALCRLIPSPPVTLRNDPQTSCKGLTHIIVPSNCPRTLRVLSAIGMAPSLVSYPSLTPSTADRVPLIQREWLYGCLEANEWIDFNDYLHPTLKRYYLDYDTTIKQLFAKCKVQLGLCSNIDTPVLREMVLAMGGSCVDSGKPSDYIVFGDEADATAWYATISSAMQKQAAFLAGKGKCVTITYLFDCMYRGELLDTQGYCVAFGGEEEGSEGSGEESSPTPVKKRKTAAAVTAKAVKTTAVKANSSGSKKTVKSTATAVSPSPPTTATTKEQPKKRRLTAVTTVLEEEGSGGEEEEALEKTPIKPRKAKKPVLEMSQNTSSLVSSLIDLSKLNKQLVSPASSTATVPLTSSSPVEFPLKATNSKSPSLKSPNIRSPSTRSSSGAPLPSGKATNPSELKVAVTGIAGLQKKHVLSIYDEDSEEEEEEDELQMPSIVQSSSGKKRLKRNSEEREAPSSPSW